MVGKKDIVGPMWKALLREIELEDPTLLQYQVYLGCTQKREAQVNQNAVQAKVTNETQSKNKNSSQPITSWSDDMEGHAETRVEKYRELGVSAFKPAETRMGRRFSTEAFRMVQENWYQLVHRLYCHARSSPDLEDLTQHAGTISHQVEQSS